ncbi:MAG: DUF1573 domain-containing protein [Planctomycetes bacterium]|nr:DUF1573 domain-containing protein [Planctomycetota bacterium]
MPSLLPSITVVLLVAISTALYAQSSDANGLRIDGALTFDEPVVTVPATVEDEQATARFRFRNAGTQTVTIVGIEPMCGCTTAELEQRVFEPGQGGSLVVVFDFGHLTGPQRKRIVIATQIGSAMRVEQDIAIKCDIPGALTLAANGTLVWVVGKDSGAKTLRAHVTKPGFGTVVDLVPPDNKAFTVRLVREATEGAYTIEMTPTTLDVDKPTSGMSEVLIDVGEGRIRKQPIWGMIIPKESK